MALYEVKLPCVVHNRYWEEVGYTMFGPYYVEADSPERACAIATEWLPKKYDLDDAPIATLWTEERFREHLRLQAQLAA